VTLILSALAAVPVLWLLAALFLDAHGRRPIPAGTWDAIVVPGCAVRPNGQASPALARRVRHAVAAWREGRAPRIVLTGGIGRAPPPAALVEERQSTTTHENARLAAALEVDGAKMADWRVLVLTDGYHVWRCRRLFARYFATADAAGSTPGWRLRIRGALREVASILLGFARG
jgi:uncharacterized SAM-binding protein YcdF (DUF218 family)